MGWQDSTTPYPKSFFGKQTPSSTSPASEDGASPVSSQPILPGAGEASIDPYARSRLEWIEYRKRRQRGDPFTLWDFRVFAEMNEAGYFEKDYLDEQDKDWTR